MVEDSTPPSITIAPVEASAPIATTTVTDSQRMEIHIPWITFLRVMAAMLAAYALLVLWPLLLLIFLALFLAVTLDAFVGWLIAHGLQRRMSLLLVISALLLMLGLAAALVLPALIQQATVFSTSLPGLQEAVLNQLPIGGAIRRSAENLIESDNWSQAGIWLGHVVSASGFALSGISQLLLLLVIALYLVLDGSKSYEWALAFFSPLNRRKLRMTCTEISSMIFGYVAGQVVTSLLVVVFTFGVLSLLNVPGALLLSIIAGVLDILPVLGFFISTAPAFLLALTVSPRTAMLVLTLFILFHAVECYFIIPKVYGRNLRLSTLTVLLGLLVGTLLAGIAGALAALPIIASYAAIERIWLKPFLRQGVSEKHDEQKDLAFGERG